MVSPPRPFHRRSLPTSASAILASIQGKGEGDNRNDGGRGPPRSGRGRNLKRTGGGEAQAALASIENWAGQVFFI